MIYLGDMATQRIVKASPELYVCVKLLSTHDRGTGFFLQNQDENMKLRKLFDKIFAIQADYFK